MEKCKDILNGAGDAAGSECASAQVSWDASHARTLHPTTVVISARREHISLLFGVEAEDEGQRVTVTLTDQVMLSPFVAKKLAMLLNKVVEACEERLGESNAHDREGKDHTLEAPARRHRPGKQKRFVMYSEDRSPKKLV